MAVECSSSSVAVVNCLLCGTTLSNSKLRRNVFTEETIEIKDALVELLERNHGTALVKRHLNSSKVVCKSKCFSLLSRLLKLRKDLNQLEKSLETAASGVMVQYTPSFSDDILSLDYASPRPLKRLRREMPSTPTRNFLNVPVAGNSPAVAVVVKGNKRSRILKLTDSLKKLGRSVGRRDRHSIACQVVKDNRLLEKVVDKMGIQLRRELIASASPDKNSSFRVTDLSSLSSFQWSDLTKDFERTAPLLHKILEKCVASNRSNEYKPNQHAIIAIVAGILLRNTSQRVNFLQHLFSLLFYASHVPKQIYNRFHKLGLCMSHKRTIAIIEEMGLDFDMSVKDWCFEIFDHCLQDITYPETMDVSSTSTGCNNQGISQEKGVKKQRENIGGIGTEANRAADAFNHSDLEHSISTCSDICSLLTPPYSPIIYSSDDYGDDNENLSDVSIFDGMFNIPLLSVLSTPLKLPTFKLVIDNLDIFVRPRTETSQRHADSLHFVHMYAVRDRINVSSFSDVSRLPDISSVNMKEILPSNHDLKALKDNITVLISRTARKHLTFFRKHINPKAVPQHITHKYSTEMSLKSEVVPLGVLLKNENKQEDMINILEHLTKYVPYVAKEDVVDDVSGDRVPVIMHKFHDILLGGDQLTVERIRGSQRARSNADEPLQTLKCLKGVVEDWHSEVAIMKAIWKKLYNTSSGMDRGTLVHIRNLLQRRSVTKKVKSDPTSCEDFFLLVVEGYVLHAVMSAFGMSSLDDDPSAQCFDNFLQKSEEERQHIFDREIRRVVDNHFNFGTTKNQSKDRDCVELHANELFSLGMFYEEYIDAIREGDGNRILRCWKYMLLIFKASNKTKYSVEAFNLLAHYHFIYSERLANQLLWSRTINVHGKPGRNIPMDLHMEHLNWTFKASVAHLGLNVIGSSLQRTGRAMKPLHDVQVHFDHITNVTTESGYHSTTSTKKDLLTIIQVLQEQEVYKSTPKRRYEHFPAITGSLLNSVDDKILKDWMTSQLKNILRYSV